MNRRGFLVLSIVGVSGLASAQDSPGPLDLVRDLYARAIRNEHVLERPLRDRFFSREIVRLIERDRAESGRRQEPGRLDFDPISDSQDPEIRNLRVTQRSLAGNRAVVEARFTHGPTGPQAVLRYDLATADRGWRVTNITKEGAQGWSLLAILQGPF